MILAGGMFIERGRIWRRETGRWANSGAGRSRDFERPKGESSLAVGTDVRNAAIARPTHAAIAQFPLSRLGQPRPKNPTNHPSF